MTFTFLPSFVKEHDNKDIFSSHAFQFTSLLIQHVFITCQREDLFKGRSPLVLEIYGKEKADG